MLHKSLFICVLLYGLAQSAEDHKGTRFALGFMSQLGDSKTGFCDIIVTALTTTSVRIQVPFLKFDRQYIVTPGDAVINQLRFNGTIRMDRDRIENKGILVTSDNEVSVYAFNGGSRTGESFLALPLTSFNRSVSSQEFLIPAFKALLLGRLGTHAQVGLTAGEDDTQVELTPPLESGGHNFSATVRVTLNTFQTYQLSIFAGDTTGYLVRSNKPVSVFGGSSCSFVPTTIQFCDCLVEQIPPTYTWGYEFITGYIAPRKTGDVFRVIPSQDNTTISVAGSVVRSGLKRGQFFQFDSVVQPPNVTSMTCSMPCLVVQYNKGRSADSLRSGTDPFMMIIPPIRQYTGTVRFSPFQTNLGQDFSNLVNIVAHKDVGPDIMINNLTLPRNCWRNVPGTDYAVCTEERILYQDYIVSHWYPGAQFMVWSYGHLNVEGYGHPVGLGMRAPLPENPPTLPPPTTPPPTAGPGNFSEKCECTVRPEANFTAGDTEPTDVVYRLPPIWFNNTKGRCLGCEEVMDQCRLLCDQRIRDIYYPDGLYTRVPINGTGGVRFRPIGQVLCERYLDDLPPPGVRLVIYYEPGTCGEIFHTSVNQHGLCCKEVDIPEIGFVVVWDAQCDGDVEFPLAWDAGN